MQHEVVAARLGTEHLLLESRKAQLQLRDKKTELQSLTGYMETLRADVQRLNDVCRYYNDEFLHAEANGK